ncbi:MAG: TonB family protein [Candidatus Binatia bacterium]|nr:TonB family protein [Candidatus Binatia bacterium]
MARTASLPSWGYNFEAGPRKQWWPAVGLALLVYASLLWLAVRLPSSPAPRREAEQPQEVTFREFVEVKPPPTVPAVAEPPVAAPAPVIPQRLKVRKVDSAPPPKPLVAPREMPKDAPREADPAEDRGVAVVGDPQLGGDPAGREGGVAGARHEEPIALPETADPPAPLPSNRPPTYPEEARSEGRTGMVVLKVVIAVDGSVSSVEVLRGEEPFVSAAVAAVRQWRYRPAMYEGRPITVYRIIQIPFKLA